MSPNALPVRCWSCTATRPAARSRTRPSGLRSPRLVEGVDHGYPGDLEWCRVPGSDRESRRAGDAGDQCVEVTDDPAPGACLSPQGGVGIGRRLVKGQSSPVEQRKELAFEPVMQL